MRKENKSVNINFVSNSRLLKEGLISLLRHYIHIQTEAYHTGSMPVNQHIPNSQNHIVLIDNGIGQETAVEWTKFCRREAPLTPIIILELTNDIDAILACVEAGANGYTLKGAKIEEVAETICLALNGEAQCSQKVIHHIFKRLSQLKTDQFIDQDINPLTPREVEVLNCVSDGLSNKEIGAELYIELRTVKHHVHNILQKLEVKRRWQAANLANEKGWLD